MDFDITQIVRKISAIAPEVSPGWGALSTWLSSQVPRRTIRGHRGRYPADISLIGWSDDRNSGGESHCFHNFEYDEAVLSTEVTGVLEAPPLSLPRKDAIALRDHLINMGFLVAHCFDDSIPCHSIIQFRSFVSF